MIEMKSVRITSEEYEEWYKKQNYRCAICSSFGCNRRTARKLCVDHCHKTGRVRGLLCHRCNTAIGLLDDSIDKLLKAIKYLHKGE